MQLRRRMVGAASVALAAGTMIAGASLTTAAIASPQQDTPEVTIEQLAQDGSGVWYSCTVSGGFVEGGFGAMASIELADGEAVAGIVQADGTVTELSASESATMLEEMEAAISVPDESDVRAGSEEECANLEMLGAGEIDVAAAVAMVEVGSRSDDFTAELVTQDETGKWISCPLDMSGGKDAALGVLAGEVETSGLPVEDDSAVKLTFPEPAEIRPGTDAECAELGSLGGLAPPN